MTSNAPDTSTVAPEEPVDPRAAALAQLAATSDTADGADALTYGPEPLTDVERAAANEAGISLADQPDPAAVRQATAEAGTGTPAESVVPAGDPRPADEYDPATAPEEPAVDRDSAIAALLGDVVTSDTRKVELTGEVVDMGGDLERLVVISRYNAMVPAERNVYGDVPAYAMGAKAGDVVLVTEKEAARGESLNALVELPSDLDAGDEATVEVTDPADDTVKTPDELAALHAKDLIDYVSRHPETAEQVVAAEQARPEAQQRKTILALTDTGK